MMPGVARPRKHAMMANLDKARAFAKERGINRVELGNKQGFLCAGGVYQYVKEAMPGASVYKVGMPYPLLEEEIKPFASGVASSPRERIPLESLESIPQKRLLAP